MVEGSADGDVARGHDLPGRGRIGRRRRWRRRTDALQGADAEATQPASGRFSGGDDSSSVGSSYRGPPGPALASATSAVSRVITRGTPPRLEGCRPASRGLTLALLTCRDSTAPGAAGQPLSELRSGATAAVRPTEEPAAPASIPRRRARPAEPRAA